MSALTWDELGRAGIDRNGVLIGMGLRGPLRRLLRRIGKPPIGGVDLGVLRKTEPLSRGFGLHRGTAIDRYYLEGFLGTHREDIRGRVLEIADARYTRAFGGERVTCSDVLHPVAGNPRATLIGNLETGAGLERDTYDCLIVTQTLQYLYDLRAAASNLHRALVPGGVLLLSVPALSQHSARDAGAWGEYWRFTRFSVRRLLEGVFSPASITVEAFGNVLAAVGFLEGLAREDLTDEELDTRDAEYELLICARAVKAPPP